MTTTSTIASQAPAAQHCRTNAARRHLCSASSAGKFANWMSSRGLHCCCTSQVGIIYSVARIVINFCVNFLAFAESTQETMSACGGVLLNKRYVLTAGRFSNGISISAVWDFKLSFHFSRSLRQRWNSRECRDAEIRSPRRIRHFQRHRLHSRVERTARLHRSTCRLFDWENHSASAVQPEEPFEAPWHCHLEAQRDRKIFGFRSAHLFADEGV